MLQEVKQGSVLGPLLFNIFLHDLFYLAESTNVCSFTDNATFYACDKDLNSLAKRLKHGSYLATEWSENGLINITYLFRNLSTKMFG